MRNIKRFLPKKNKDVIHINKRGEILVNDLNSDIKKKFKSDTALDKSFIAYIVMAVCACIDAMCFYSLFALISFDSPLMLATEVVGLLIGFDLIPCYLGIQLKRLKAGMEKDKFILWIALSATVIGVLINLVLRAATIKLISPDGVVDATAISITVFGCFIPFVTSLASFFVSYLTYNPRKEKIRKQELLLNKKQDDIRRLQAYLDEYDANPDFAENLLSDDEKKYESMKKYQTALALSYAEMVRQRLKCHLADPTANNAISEETCASVLNRLEEEIAALNKSVAPKPCITLDATDNAETSNEFIA